MQDQPIISPLGRPFIELPVIDSTNNYAFAAIREGRAEHGLAIFAHEQKGGKGQRGKSWEAEKGANIAISVIIRPGSLPIYSQPAFNAAMALGVHRFFAGYAGAETRIKWPNDLYWKDQKAGGILIENIISGKQDSKKETAFNSAYPTEDAIAGSWKWAVVGIGININQVHFSPALPNPVSLKQITGSHYDPLQLAAELCKHLDHLLMLLNEKGASPVLDEYNQVLYKKGEMVKLKKSTRVFATMVKGVASTGQLITTNDGIEEYFDSGDLIWL